MIQERSVQPQPAPKAQPRKEPLSERQQAARARIIGTVSVLCFLALWEGIVRLGFVNPMFTSSPSLIVEKFFQLLHEGTLGTDLSVSGQEFIIGYLLAVVVGVTLGVSIGWYKGVAAALDPFVSALYATPRIALLPVIIIWLGIGIGSKVAIVFLEAVFLIIVNTIAGIRSVDEQLLKAARSFGASDRQIFTSIALPSAVPFLIAGLRLAIGAGLVGIVVGEMYAATAGIGYEITVAGETFQTDRAFVYICILAIAGIVLVWLLRRLEQRFESWRPQRAR